MTPRELITVLLVGAALGVMITVAGLAAARHPVHVTRQDGRHGAQVTAA